jgi:2-iminobutanoate/2-iminopropanoate deaminase
MPISHPDTPNAPPVAGPYSPAVRAGDWLVCSGQVGYNPAAGTLADGAAAQCRQALANLTAVLADCGASWADVAKTTIYVTDLGQFGAINDVYGEVLGEHRPARATLQVAALPLGAQVEIEAWAFLG